MRWLMLGHSSRLLADGYLNPRTAAVALSSARLHSCSLFAQFLLFGLPCQMTNAFSAL